MDVAVSARPLVLPPPYTSHWVSSGDAFEEACARAFDEGAGTLVCHEATGAGRAGRFDFAVVLEPDMPLHEARKAVLVGMVALADAVAAHAPPERDIRFTWPTGLVLDGSRLGGMRVAIAPDTPDDAVPDWMVLGVELIADRDHLDETGSHPDSVSLKEEDFSDPLAIIESFAAHLMLYFDRWTHGGFETIGQDYAGRLTQSAVLTETGDRMMEGTADSLAQAIKTAAWRGSDGPKL